MHRVIHINKIRVMGTTETMVIIKLIITQIHTMDAIRLILFHAVLQIMEVTTELELCQIKN